MTAIHHFIILFFIIQRALSIDNKTDTSFATPCVETKHAAHRWTVICDLNYNINQLPNELKEDVEIFKLTRTDGGKHDLSSIVPLMNFDNLFELKISKTRTQVIPKTFSDQLVNMVKLDLSDNNINVFYEESFRKFKNLTLLDLSNNEIGLRSPFTSNVFRQLTKLKVLNLSNNRINFIPDATFNVTELVELRLENNRLTQLITPMFRNMFSYLNYLNVSNNLLDHIDENLFNVMPNLKTLDLSHNHLKTFKPEHFKNLKSIECIELNFNQLENLDDHLFDSMNLERLNLGNNNLVNISSKAFDKSLFTELNLTSNRNLNISKLRVSLDGLAYLEYLDLSNCSITNDDLLDLPFKNQYYNLKRLNLSRNLLTYLPRMPRFRKIQSMDFSFNQIKRLNQTHINLPEIFDDMRSRKAYYYFHHNDFSCSQRSDLDALGSFSQFNEKCNDDNYYCLKCNEPVWLKDVYVRDLKLTKMYSTYNSHNSKFSYILVVVILLVVISILVFLFLLYRQRIFHSVYYTGHYYTKEARAKKMARDSMMNGDVNQVSSTKHAKKIEPNESDKLINGANGEANGKLKNIEIRKDSNGAIDDSEFYDIDLSEAVEDKQVNTSSFTKCNSKPLLMSLYKKAICSSDSKSQKQNEANANQDKSAQLSPESMYNVSEHSNCVNIYKVDEQSVDQKVNSEISDAHYV